MDLLKSPLYSKYLESNAKLVDFAGWEMPISFSGLIKEHESVRSSAGLFDISHMGVISVRGINPKDYIQKLFPTNLYSFSEGQGLYTVMLNDKGGIIDDLIIYDLGIQENDISELLLIVNASRYEEDFRWIKNNLNKYEISITNFKKDKVLLALQGKTHSIYLKNGLNLRSHISLTLDANIKFLNIFRLKKKFSFRRQAIRVKMV